MSDKKKGNILSLVERKEAVQQLEAEAVYTPKDMICKMIKDMESEEIGPEKAMIVFLTDTVDEEGTKVQAVEYRQANMDVAEMNLAIDIFKGMLLGGIVY